MNKTILGVAMVVVFCITWWIVAGEAWQAAQQAEQAEQKYKQVYNEYEQALKQAEQALDQTFEQIKQAVSQADQASIIPSAHFRTQASWGIGAGLLADVLVLVGALAWSKRTAKP